MNISGVASPFPFFPHKKARYIFSRPPLYQPSVRTSEGPPPVPFFLANDFLVCMFSFLSFPTGQTPPHPPPPFFALSNVAQPSFSLPLFKDSGREPISLTSLFSAWPPPPPPPFKFFRSPRHWAVSEKSRTPLNVHFSLGVLRPPSRFPFCLPFPSENRPFLTCLHLWLLFPHESCLSKNVNRSCEPLPFTRACDRLPLPYVFCLNGLGGTGKSG